MAANEGVGTRAERQRKRRWLKTIGMIAGSGFVAGFAFALAEDSDAFLGGSIPGWLAIAIAASYLVAMIWGTIAYKKVADEVDMQANIWGSAVGASALLLVYPPWWLLWRGKLTGEPVHEILFLLLFGSAIAGYIWKKYR